MRSSFQFLLDRFTETPCICGVHRAQGKKLCFSLSLRYGLRKEPFHVPMLPIKFYEKWPSTKTKELNLRGPPLAVVLRPSSRPLSPFPQHPLPRLPVTWPTSKCTWHRYSLGFQTAILGASAIDICEENHCIQPYIKKNCYDKFNWRKYLILARLQGNSREYTAHRCVRLNFGIMWHWAEGQCRIFGNRTNWGGETSCICFCFVRVVFLPPPLT